MLPPKDIEATYKQWIDLGDGGRSDYLEDAEDAAELTLPSLRPKGTKISMRPYTQLGTQAVRSLAATIHRLIMPVSVKWYRLGLTEEAIQTINEQFPEGQQRDAAASKIHDLLARAEKQVTRYLARTNSRSKTAAAILRNLVEGTTALHFDEEGVRVFPLRNIAVYREAGDVVVLITREEFLPDDVQEQTPPQRDEDRSWIYSWVDYQTGEVWQQQSIRDEAGKKQEPKRVNAKSSQYVVFVGMVPDVDHYSTSYVYDHLSIINEIDHLSRSLGEAAAAAALMIPLLDPASSITEQEFEERRPGQAFRGRSDEITFVATTQKISDWAFVGEYRATLREEVARIFALGIKDRAARASTATEILEIVQELETFIQDLLVGYEETLQKPEIEAVMAVLGLDSVELEGGLVFEVTITTGQNALRREASIMKFVQAAEVVKPLDPSVQIDGVELMNRLGAAHQFDTEGLIFRAEPEAPQGIEQQAQAAAAAAGQPTTPSGTPTTAGGPQPGPPPGSQSPGA